MDLQLKLGEDFSKGVLRLIEEHRTSSYEALCKLREDNMHEIIHEVRKSFKKLRAIFRLIRPATGEDFYQNENYFYRDLGKEISALRDHTAIIEVLQQIKSQYQQSGQKPILTLPLQDLKKKRQISENVFLYNDKLNELKIRLHNKQYEIPAKNLNIRSFAQIAPGLKKVYKKSWQALNMSMSTRSTKQLHEWRKHVKYLRYQLDILSRIWPRIMASFEKELHDLSDLLGFDHDLSIIEKQIESNAVEFESVSEEALLITLIHHQRNQMQLQALIKGQNFFHETPDAFVEKINTYWTTYHKQIKMDGLPP